MRFRVIIDVPDETISTYHNFTQKHEENLHLNLLNKPELEKLIKDMIEEQTSWDVLNCDLIDVKDLNRLKEHFKQK